VPSGGPTLSGSPPGSGERARGSGRGEPVAARAGAEIEGAQPADLQLEARLLAGVERLGSLGESWEADDRDLLEVLRCLEHANPFATEFLLTAVRASDAARRRGAAILLARAGGAVASAALRDAFVAEDDDLARRVMLRLLVDLEHAETAPALLEVWTGESERQSDRLLALEGLARLARPEARAVLDRPPGDGTALRAAESGLVRALDVGLGEPNELTAIVERIALTGSDLSVRLEAVEGLRRAATPDATVALDRIASATRAGEEVRRRASEVLRLLAQALRSRE
jgi:hypothetical protein